MEDILIRCSQLGKIMTNARGKDYMGDTAHGYLKQLHRENNWNRKAEVKSKFIEKGNACEEDSITLLSVVTRYNFRKNEERINNEYLTGLPDLYLGEKLIGCECGFDIKTSWSWETFPYKSDKLNADYYWQAMGYMALTGAKQWTIAFCLVNNTLDAITQAKQRLWYKMGQPDDSNYNYLKGLVEIEKNMIYDMKLFKKQNPYFDSVVENWDFDIPANERVVQYHVVRDENAIQQAYKRIIESREFYKTL